MHKQYDYATVLSTLMPEKNTYGAHIIGRTWYAHINPETIAKASLWKGNYTGYVGVVIEIINKRYGVIDTLHLYFSTYCTENNYSVYKSLNCCMNPEDKIYWDVELTPEELKEMHTHINTYLDMFDSLPSMD